MPQSVLPLPVLVEICRFLNRDQLECILNSSRILYKVVERYFPTAPYRFVKGTMYVKVNISGGLVLSVVIEPNSASFVDHLDPRTGTWETSDPDHEFGEMFSSVSALRPYLKESVRIESTCIYVENVRYTRDNIHDLASVSHVWTGQELVLGNTATAIKQDAFEEMFAIPGFLGCREFVTTGLSLHPLHIYPSVYGVEFIRIDFDLEPTKMEDVLHLIENKAFYPASKTNFVVACSAWKPELISTIQEDFTSSSTPYSYRAVFEAGKHRIDNFRVENSGTKEVLQLNLMTAKEAKKKSYILQQVNSKKVYVLERFFF